MNSRCGERYDFMYDTDSFGRYLPTLENDYADCGQYDIPFRFTMDNSVNNSGIQLLDFCISTDLRIVNGRIGDDSGCGCYTYMSHHGNSLIDYALLQFDLFHLIDDFIVHDLTSLSTHTPIQLNLCSNKVYSNTDQYEIRIDKIIWNDDKKHEYKYLIESKLDNLEGIVDNILSNDLSLNSGMEKFATTVYQTAYCIFGKSVTLKTQSVNAKKIHKNGWFTNECNMARRRFRNANNAYRKFKSNTNRQRMMSERNIYNVTKRKAENIYKRKQRKQFSESASNQPSKFWQ